MIDRPPAAGPAAVTARSGVPDAPLPAGRAGRFVGEGGASAARSTVPSTASPLPATSGAATGGVRLLLRLEGLALLIAAVAGYAQHGIGWGAFALLFLLPDLAFLGYLAGARIGAAAYDTTHSTLGPLALLLAGVLGGLPTASALALIWFAHIGLDRALGYGLKYASGFGATHLGRIGRRDPW